ncbi:chromate transporter [Treponema sp. OMZ 792]|uniref:chromate transporter n=1 Tax=unclassified Treponema TaxID=2638727 RepID=UPI0020A2F149|nr:MULTISPECIES: chromate transporter [unclassified Treponema]UTC76028.1 chromate transporter [Treponema sp. OMZ 792]UTC80030.1 chromate transporter [Treponema sp. OMZ 798]
MKKSERFKNYLSLFAGFFKIGLVTFGGGLAMLPILKRDLVDSKGWVTEAEILDYFAIGQSTPGIIAVNVATFVGYKRGGLIGSVFSTSGVVFPSLIIITLIAAFVSNFNELVWVQKALRGINVAVAVLLVKAVFSFGKKTVLDLCTFLIAALSFVFMFVFKVQGIWIVIGSALSGWLFQTFKSRRLLKENRGEES